MEKVLEITFPVGFRVGGEGEVFAGLLAGDAALDALQIDATAFGVEVGFLLGQFAAQFRVEHLTASLAVCGGLAAPFVFGGGSS